MSHFTVLVVGEDVEKQLAPFHEFECDGVDDEYVQDIDETEESRADYEKWTNSKYKDPEGVLHDPYQDKFYRDFTAEEIQEVGSFKLMGTGGNGKISWTSKDWGDGRGYRAKVRFVPDGWEKVQVPTKDSRTFAEFIEDWNGRKPVRSEGEIDLAGDHKYGYVLVDEAGEVIKSIKRTNPRKEWDWYSIGGRWTGFFKLKPGTDGVVGRPGVFGGPAEPGYADSVLKRDVDFDGMRREFVEKRLAIYRRFHSIVAGRPVPIWSKIREKHSPDIDAARAEYQACSVAQDLNKCRDFVFEENEEFDMPEDEFIRRASNAAIATFAVLKDGVWSERGSMGWWGCVSGEKDKQEWHAEYAKLLDGLPDDTRLTLVDCHI